MSTVLPMHMHMHMHTPACCQVRWQCHLHGKGSWHRHKVVHCRTPGPCMHSSVLLCSNAQLGAEISGLKDVIAGLRDDVR